MREVDRPESDVGVERGKTNTDQTDRGEFYTLGTLDRLIRVGGYMQFPREETEEDTGWDLTHTGTLSLFRQGGTKMRPNGKNPTND